MKKISVILLAMVLITAILGAEECGERKNMKMGERHPQMMQEENNKEGNHWEMAIDELEMTDSQLETLSQLKSDHLKNIIRIKSEIEILNIDKRNALRDHDFDEAKTIIKKLSVKREEMSLNKLQHSESKWELMTDEQKEKLETMRRNHPKMKMKNKENNNRDENKHKGMNF